MHCEYRRAAGVREDGGMIQLPLSAGSLSLHRSRNLGRQRDSRLIFKMSTAGVSGCVSKVNRLENSLKPSDEHCHFIAALQAPDDGELSKSYSPFSLSGNSDSATCEWQAR